MLLKSCYILQSAVEHSCIPAAAPCSVLQCLTAAATLRLIAGLLHRHCTIATLQGPHFMMGGDGGTAVHLMQSSSIALFMVCACLQSLVYWRVMFWSTDRRRTLPMLHRLSAKWIPPPHLHITWHLNMCRAGKNVLTKGISANVYIGPRHGPCWSGVQCWGELRSYLHVIYYLKQP